MVSAKFIKTGYFFTRPDRLLKKDLIFYALRTFCIGISGFYALYVFLIKIIYKNALLIQMDRTRIKTILTSDASPGTVCVKGWVRTRRDSKTFSFIELNDGSCLANVQVIADESLENYEQVKKLATGSSVSITGTVHESPGKGQKWEIHATGIDIFQIAPDEYPLQKKRHTDEFLRTISHLRPRTNKYGAAFRIRSRLSYTIHKYFQDLGFTYIHTPIITGSDCEGAGELFRVTSLDPTTCRK